MNKWYYCKNGQQLGPIDLDELTEFVERGELSADTRVWKVGTPEWVRIYKHPELIGAISGLLEPSPRPSAAEKPRSIVASMLAALGKRRR